MENSDLMHIAELARVLDTTEEAVRQHIKRRTDAIPPWFWRGRRISWRRETVKKWSEEREADAINERAVRQARRRLGGNTP